MNMKTGDTFSPAKSIAHYFSALALVSLKKKDEQVKDTRRHLALL
jgi:hypothetical protein